MKKLKIFIFLLITSLSLFGCGRKQDINQLLFVSAIGIDKTENGFKLVAQIVNKNVLVPNPPQIAPVNVATAEGSTIAEAFAEMSSTLPNRPFFINLQLLVFSEDIAKEGIEEYLHFFLNYNEAQHEYNIIVLKDVKAEDFLSQISVFSVFPTRILIDKIKNAEKNYGFAKEIFIEDIVDSLHSESKVLVLSSMTLEGDIKKGQNVDTNKTTLIEVKIDVSDMAIMKKGKLLGWLNKHESLAYNYVNDYVERGHINIEGDKNNRIFCLTINNKGKVKVDIDGGKPKVTIDIKFDAYVVEDTSGKIDLETKYFEMLKQRAEESIKKEIHMLFNKCRDELNVDIFSLADYFNKFENKWWKENKQNFDEIYKNLDIEVNVKANFLR